MSASSEYFSGEFDAIHPMGTQREQARGSFASRLSPFFRTRFDDSLGRLNGTNETELCKGGYAVIQPDLFDDLAVFEPKHGRSCEMHFATGGSPQGTSEKVAKGRASVRSIARRIGSLAAEELMDWFWP